jgi:molybdopterin/thiamine biosynthesis adenylyltransferase
MGRFNADAGPDPLEGMLADADQVAARRRRRGRPLGPAPKQSVLVEGAGRLGAHTATLLARMGVPLKVVDRDVVEARNLDMNSTPFRPKDVGLPKALALKGYLAEMAPGVPVEAFQADLLLMPDEDLLALARSTGIVLGLIDNGQVLFKTNSLCYDYRPVIYAAGHHGARTGDVLLTRPGHACLRCLLNIDSPDQIQTLDGEPTHGLDILSIAHLCAKVVLALLGDHRLGNPREVFDPDQANFLFLENRLAPGNPGNLPPRSLRIERRPQCPVCGGT